MKGLLSLMCALAFLSFAATHLPFVVHVWPVLDVWRQQVGDWLDARPVAELIYAVAVVYGLGMGLSEWLPTRGGSKSP